MGSLKHLTWTGKLLTTGLLAALIFSFLYSREIRQENPETLFLTTEGILDYQDYRQRAPELSMAVLRFKQDPATLPAMQSLVESHIKDDFRLITPHTLAGMAAAFPGSVDSVLRLSSPGAYAFLIIGHPRSPAFGPLLDKLIPALEGQEVQISGIPYTNYLLDRYSTIIQTRLFPLLFLVALGVVLLLVRDLRISLILFAPALMAATHTLSCIEWRYGTMNLVTSTLPLITFTINLSLVFHLHCALSEYADMRKVLRRKWQPIALMTATTSIGFGSLMISEIQVIRDFASIACFIILATALITTAWMAAWAPWLKQQPGTKHFGWIPAGCFRHSLPKRWAYALGAASLALGVWAYPRIPVITDATLYFPESSGIKDQIDEICENVAGMPIFDLLLPADADLKTTLANLKSQSFSQDYRILSPSLLAGIPPGLIPDELRFLSQTLLPGGQRRLLLLGKPANQDVYSQDLITLQNALQSTKPEINGMYHQLMTSQKAMIAVLFKSLGLSVLIVSLLAYLSTRQTRTLWIFLFVNLVPALISSGILLLLRSSINIATVMTFSIAMGIIVDGTFHLLHALRHPGSFDDFIKTTVAPILASSLIFMICFSVLLFDAFVPIHQFGQNLAIMIFLGTLFDLFILPSLYLGHHQLMRAFHDIKT
jgi:predicted RND superfamily exporter protein